MKARRVARFGLALAALLAVAGVTASVAATTSRTSLTAAASARAVRNAPHPDRARLVAGADVSDLERIEAAGARFGDDAGRSDALEILKAHGVGALRVRVWHSPQDGACDLASALRLAARARGLGLDVLLDLHYSDTWADPAHQTAPAAWAGVRGTALEDSVRRYTRDVVAAFARAGLAPRWVQLGNEVSSGLLWPEGRVAAPVDSARWTRFAALLRSAARGVREGARGARRPAIVVHFDRGGDADGAAAFFARLERTGLGFDAAGVSYYPWWHGDTLALDRTIERLARATRRDVFVLETGYPWTTSWFDTTRNVIGEYSDLGEFGRASRETQAEFVAAVRRAVERCARGAALFYWGAVETPAPRRGSAWENCALFDARGLALPALDALGRGGAPVTP